jgi:hypothetical protein
MQHSIIDLLIDKYIKKKKNAFYKLNLDQRPDYIKNKLLGDKMIIHELRGLILGLFTDKEIEFYLENQSKINKRIQALLFQRIISFI